MDTGFIVLPNNNYGSNILLFGGGVSVHLPDIIACSSCAGVKIYNN